MGLFHLGNLPFDVNLTSESAASISVFGRTPDSLIMVAGSTSGFSPEAFAQLNLGTFQPLTKPAIPATMTRFRPCIDLHAGEVKQIVGGTLDSTSEALKTNYVSKHPAAYYARLYKDNALTGAHVIMLGAGNDKAAREALQAWPGGLQVGGGITDKNARDWIDAGAEKVRLLEYEFTSIDGLLRLIKRGPGLITSYLFPDGKFSQERLDAVLQALGGDKNKLVIDLSCRRRGGESWYVAMNKWQTITDMEVTSGTTHRLTAAAQSTVTVDGLTMRRIHQGP
jgi:phosphoribosylformimino-5-aminoimidazole carboxamide ribonucleotide (ProFAR) isomerase